MAKLYQLADNLETAYKLIAESIDEETGEINPDAVALLNECREDFETKIAGVAEFIKRLTADYEAYDREEERLYKTKKAIGNRIDWLKRYAKDCMIKANRDKVETTSCSVSLGTSHAVNVLDLAEIPAEFKTVEENIKVDKKAIGEAFKNGQVVAGVEYVTNTTLRIR